MFHLLDGRGEIKQDSHRAHSISAMTFTATGTGIGLSK